MSNLWHQYYVVKNASTIRKMYPHHASAFYLWNKAHFPPLKSLLAQKTFDSTTCVKLKTSSSSYCRETSILLNILTGLVQAEADDCVCYSLCDFFLTWTSRVIGPLLSTSKISPFLVPTRMWPWPRDMARMEGLSSKSNPAESVK